MDTDFSIDLNNPNYILPSGEGHDFMSVFSTCFEYPNRNLLLFWKNSVIELNYDYMISHIILDVIEMLTALVHESTGKYKCSFATNGFEAEWQITWNFNELSVLSSWGVVSNETSDSLVENNAISLTTSHFLSQWLKPVVLLKDIIDNSGVQVGDWYYTYDKLTELIERTKLRIEELSKSN